MLTDIKIFLGSKSPRRKQILESCGFNVEIIDQDIDESIEELIETSFTAEYLAIKKADSITKVLGPNEVLVTADTIVILENMIYGKPKDGPHAMKMIQALSGKTHEVITGVCIQTSKNRVHFSESSMVTFDEISHEETQFYVDNFSPFDKAGAYAIQEWIGYTKIKKIEGTFTNIMGLPSNRLYNTILSIMKSLHI